MNSPNGHVPTLEHAAKLSDVALQSACLTKDYILSRLRREQIDSERLNCVTTEKTFPGFNDVSKVIQRIGLRLELAYPEIYGNLRDNFSEVHFCDGELLRRNLNMLCSQIIKSKITWGKIVSMFVVCGTMAVETVRLGCSQLINGIVENFAAFVERQLSRWITAEKGWKTIIFYFAEPINRNLVLGLTALGFFIGLIMVCAVWRISSQITT